MAVSRLEIFKTVLKPEKNAKIDNIDAFLDNEKYSVKVYDNNTYQYQRIALDTEMKITADQAVTNGQSFGNYARLTQDGNKYYYFIRDTLWTSASSCRLLCSIDSINTFADKLEWSDKTNIMREHGARFKKVQLTATKKHSVNSSFDGPIKELQYQFTIPQLKNAKFISISAIYVDAANAADLIDIIMDNFNPGTGMITFTETYAKRLNYPKFSGQAIVEIKYECYKRNIDFMPEGINPQLYGEDQGLIYNDNDPDSWYVIYNSIAEAKPVETLLCKDTGITAMISSTTTTTAEFTAATLGSNYYFVDPFNGNGRFENSSPFWQGWIGQIQSQTISDGGGNTILKTDCVRSAFSEFDRSDLVSCVFTKEGAKIRVYKVNFKVVGYGATGGYAKTATEVVSVGIYDKIAISSGFSFKIFQSSVKPTAADNMRLYDQYAASPLLPFEGTARTPTYISGIDKLNRSLTTLIKVIKLPYCPISYTLDNGKYVFDYNVIVKTDNKPDGLNGSFIKLDDSFDFGAIIETNVDSPLEKANEQLLLRPSPLEPKKIENESKLYHSEFYRPKFLYDSFGFLFDLEKLENQPTNDKMLLSFTPSRNFNSTMMFKFPDYITKGHDTEDFNNLLIANRNNETPIFNSEYLNYTKYGENYDQKVKNTNLAWGLGTTISNTLLNAGIALSGIGPLAKKAALPTPTAADIAPQIVNGALATTPQFQAKVAATEAANSRIPSLQSQIVKSGAVGSAIGGVFSFLNVLKQNQMEGMAINHKKELLANQSTSISTCDSIDLLEKYSGNKAKLKLYKTDELTKEQLFDLFYYCGYNRGYRGIPDTHSRYWFNFIQCEPEFKGLNSVVYEPFINDIKARYETGVTVYHYHPDFANCYDIDQENENWESFLIA